MKSILSTILCLFILASCNRGDDSCEDHIYLGEFAPTSKSLSTIPYQENSHVVFTDSLGNELEYVVSDLQFQYIQSSIPGYCPSNYYQDVTFDHDAGMYTVWLRNDSADFEIEITLLSLQAWEIHKIYDHLSITYQTEEYGHQCLDIPVDQRTLRDPEFEELISQIDSLESVSFFDKTFYNVYHHKYFPDTFLNKTYYNFELGIVAIRDQHGKRWVLDSVSK